MWSIMVSLRICMFFEVSTWIWFSWSKIWRNSAQVNSCWSRLTVALLCEVMRWNALQQDAPWHHAEKNQAKAVQRQVGTLRKICIWIWKCQSFTSDHRMDTCDEMYIFTTEKCLKVLGEVDSASEIFWEPSAPQFPSHQLCDPQVLNRNIKVTAKWGNRFQFHELAKKTKVPNCPTPVCQTMTLLDASVAMHPIKRCHLYLCYLKWEPILQFWTNPCHPMHFNVAI